MKKMNLKLPAACLLALMGSSLVARAQTETKQRHDTRMEWWREAKFGMFVHWGIYAVPAGEYGGKTQPNSAEWIMNKARIPIAGYTKYAAQFNPTQFNAEAFVRQAREAGMRYLVITAKHHDGFSMFDSKASAYNIVQATPFKRDVLKELAAACAKEGLRFGFYYSQAQDWNHPGGMGNTWDQDMQRVSTDEYVRAKAIPEVRQLLTEYGPIGIFWWDTPRKMSRESLDGLYALRALQPGLITNDRLGEGYRGDHETFERRIPAQGAVGQDWEVCMPISGSWGYKSSDTKFLSAQTLIRNLVDIASKGGNYLLNVSPTAQGILMPAAVERLQALGAWMKVNGAAIYGTTASPFPPLEWGRCTLNSRAEGGSLYLAVFEWPKEGQLVLPGLRSKVVEAHLLANGRNVPITTEAGRTTLALPTQAPDAVASVIEVKFSGPLDVAPAWPEQQGDGSLTLNVADAEIRDVPGAKPTKLKAAGGAVWVAEWVQPETSLGWKFRATKSGTYAVSAIVYGGGTGKLRVELGASSSVGEVKVEDTTVVDKVVQHTVSLGKIKVEGSAVQTLRLIPEQAGWQTVTLQQVELKPEP